MAIAERRARERAEREQLIVEHADTLLGEHGYLGLNLDELADRIEYSKATIYNHFESKEDLLAAVDLRHLEARADLFSRALLFDGHTRERMMVVGWADRIISQMFPNWSSLHQLMSMPSFMEKVAEKRQRVVGDVSFKCLFTAYEIIRQARAVGDLVEKTPTESQILTGLISLAKGAHLLEEGKDRFPEEAGIQPLEMLEENYHIYLDGVGWKPLRTDFDYAETEKRIHNDVFAAELASLAAKN